MTENDESESSGIVRVAMKIPDSVRLEDKDCPLGCARSDEPVLTGHDRLSGLPGQFSVVRCKNCGLMRTNPRPTSDTIGFYYPDDYGPYQSTQVIDVKPSGALKRFLKPIVNWAFDDKTQALPALKPSYMLEIGCASGSFLHKMAGKGWHVEGIEFSGKAAQAAIKLGYKVHIGSLEDAPPPAHQYDLIVGWMVLEHLHDPVACLKKMSEWASPNACLALSIPNAGSLEFKYFENKWYALQLPTHLYHFTPDSLAKMLAGGGWVLDVVHHQRSVANLVYSLAYCAESRGFKRLGEWLRNSALRGGIWFYLRFPMDWIFGVFGQTGRMTVWAKKIP
jgi:2-polyprenyl-3-methyl-5-hydroxy-6-metoxy-1,4-benzoquinol methylase